MAYGSNRPLKSQLRAGSSQAALARLKTSDRQELHRFNAFSEKGRQEGTLLRSYYYLTIHCIRVMFNVMHITTSLLAFSFQCEWSSVTDSLKEESTDVGNRCQI
ncbi:hypothetical protein JOB18_024859 [Solea senegalensis]|uniref:Uncharacterized protein n=1 Tax=Solea senegalensis TaxID=28829 RepID=A0AAV6SZL9_SOLSE|nr:hypothetical protein JOB18_024859 [Solea senegalensis]